MYNETKALIQLAIEDFNKIHESDVAVIDTAFNKVVEYINVLWESAEAEGGEGCIVEIDPSTMNTIFKMNLYVLDVSVSQSKICDAIKQCKRISISHAGEFMFFEFEFMPIVRVS